MYMDNRVYFFIFKKTVFEIIAIIIMTEEKKEEGNKNKETQTSPTFVPAIGHNSLFGFCSSGPTTTYAATYSPRAYIIILTYTRQAFHCERYI